MCLAAIHGGANAIYVGMPGFNARGRSVDQSVEQLKEMIDLCHLYGVKVHIAFNILIFEDEIEHAIEMLDEVIPLGPDALIIQDIGLAKIVKDIYPDQVIHGSTQMTVTNDKAIEYLGELDIKRFVLGRENSLDEIKKIREATDKELEVFVHGALCVAYSGQCFTSESIGGRSANRGQCAQSCRFGYELIVDGEKKDLIDKEYLVSPQDLCGINEVSKLQEIGIESFKIEGRLKSAAFVGTTARSYANALEAGKPDNKDIEKMATTYSRGFFSGWLNGVDHQRLVRGTYKDHRGIYLGKLLKVRGNNISIRTTREIKKGMGLVLCDDKEKIEIGSSVYEVFKNGDETVIGLSKDANLSSLKLGAFVYLNSNPDVVRDVEKTVTDLTKQKRIKIKVEFTANVGEKAALAFLDEDDNFVEVQSEDILEAAKKPYDLQSISDELSSLSRTIYEATEVAVDMDSETLPFLHSKVLKKLKSAAVTLLNEKRVEVVAIDRFDIKEEITPKTSTDDKRSLNIVLRDLEQVKTFVKSFKDFQSTINLSVILDFEFGKDYKFAAQSLKEIGIEVGIATNRILKPGEYHHLNVLGRLAPDFILTRNLGAVKYLQEKFPEIRLKGDFSLNIANSYTANFILSRGLETVCSSYDLNALQLSKMLSRIDASRMEVTVHQYMPSFHMEHCVFAAFLSKGSSFKDCGKPCEKHNVELKDQFGNHHFLKADQECRNTMFNAVAQSAAGILPSLIDAGVKHFRVEMLDEKDDILIQKIRNYISFFENEIDTESLTKRLGTFEKFGIGSGQLLKNERKTMVSLHN
ncbi:peptidase, U32 family [Bacteriovorax sp. Seq25_V]|nr:peptidase, U32 family [Bacteriovorax sp. Seq25_V]